MDPKTKAELTRELKIHAKAINLPSGAADSFIKTTIEAVEPVLAKKSTITDRDLKRYVSRELKKYNRDFAYVYEKYDTII